MRKPLITNIMRSLHSRRRAKTLIPMPAPNVPTGVGEFTQAKIQFLQAAMRRAGHGINRKNCRPLHPHGKRLLDEGLLTLRREDIMPRYSYVMITDKGIAELRRLEQKFKLQPTQAPPAADQ